MREVAGPASLATNMQREQSQELFARAAEAADMPQDTAITAEELGHLHATRVVGVGQGGAGEAGGGQGVGGQRRAECLMERE